MRKDFSSKKEVSDQVDKFNKREQDMHKLHGREILWVYDWGCTQDINRKMHYCIKRTPQLSTEYLCDDGSWGL